MHVVVSYFEGDDFTINFLGILLEHLLEPFSDFADENVSPVFSL